MTAAEDSRLSSSQKTGLTDSTQLSTSSRSSRYGLDEDDMRSILVYEYRGDLEILPEKELAERVNKDPYKRVTRKHIPRGTWGLELYGHDLFLPEEKDESKHTASYWLSLASVPIPRRAYWSNLVMGSYDQLYIVSRETTPDSSSYGGSRKISPSSTFEYGTQEATTGAEQ